MTRLITQRTLSAVVFAAAVIVAAPAIVVSQSGRANEPWNDPWSGPWPALLDRPAAVDPELAALQQRIDASLERLMTSGGDTALPSRQQTNSDATPHRFLSQIAERAP